MANNKPQSITQEMLDRINYALRLDSATGELYWKVTLSKRNKAGNMAGSIGKDGYRRTTIDGVRLPNHRIVYAMVHGPIIGKVDVDMDHIDGNRLNNIPANLRLVSRTANTQNRRKAQSKSITGVLGVRPHRSKYQALIRHNGVQIILGSFDTVEEASTAYMEAKRRLHLGCTF